MDPESSPRRSAELDELLRAVRARVDEALTAAKSGLALSEREHEEALGKFFRRCIECFERAQAGDGPLNAGASAPAQPGEQVSTATDASGDGADDAQVTPESGRGKPGSWPTY